MLKVKSRISAKRNEGTQADSFYVGLPSKLTQDSAFTFKKGDEVNVEFIPEKKMIVVTAVDLELDHKEY